MKKLALATLSLGLLSSIAQGQSATFDSVEIEEGRGVAPASAECSAGIVVDDGSFENGIRLLGGPPAAFVNRFSLGNVRIVGVCVALIRSPIADPPQPNPDSNYGIVIVDDDGGAGEPGTLLANFGPQTATDVPFNTVSWYKAYTDFVVAPGDYYIGEEQPGDGAHYIAVDTGSVNQSRIGPTSGPWIPNIFEDTPFGVRLLVTDPNESRATFEVFKHFDDGNPAEVDVTIECTTGDPISQMATFSEDEGPIEFIVKDFDEGELDCEVTESVPEGYSVEYDDNLGTVNRTSCVYEEVEFGQAFHCNIENTIDNVDVFVDKIWIDEQAAENGSFLFAGAKWSCDPVANRDSGPSDDEGLLWFTGSPSVPWDYDSFNIYPHYDGSLCSVTELELDSDILSDDSDCDEIVVFPGFDLGLEADEVTPAEACTIINTRVFAGIPTLSQFGLVLLALMMLGIGFVGFRRFA